MSEHDEPQLQMVWPEHLFDHPPTPQPLDGYVLRTYQKGDEARFYEIMALSGWGGWDGGITSVQACLPNPFARVRDFRSVFPRRSLYGHRLSTFRIFWLIRASLGLKLAVKPDI